MTTLTTLPKPTRTLSLRLFEDMRGGQPHKVDRAAGVIRGVKIIGTESPNGIPGYPQVKGRRYPLAILKAAIPLYEGTQVNVDHLDDDDSQQSSWDGFGELRNVQARTDGLYGDLHFLKTHPMAARVCEAAERMPGQFGLSPHHHVDGDIRGDVYEVSRILDVESVDLVRRPATTKGLFEHRENKEGCAMGDADNKDKEKEVKEEGEEPIPETPMDAPLDEPMDAPMDAPVDAAAPPTAQAVYDMLQQWQSSLDVATTKEEVFGTIDAMMASLTELGATAAVSEAEGDEDDEEDDEEEKDKEQMPMEARRKTKPVSGKMLLENRALRLCLKAGLRPSDVFLESLMALGTEEKMTALLTERTSLRKTVKEARRPVVVPQKPRTGGAVRKTVTEAKTPGTFLLPTADEYKAAILN